MMKNSKLLTVILAALVLNACIGDKELEENLYSSLTQEQAFSNPDASLLNVTAAYGPLQDFVTNKATYILQEVPGDAITVPTRGGDWSDNGKWVAMHQHNFDDKNAEIEQTWNSIFEMIAKVNQNISFLDVGEDSQFNFIDEMRTLRAYSYYMLMDMFGNVPIYTEDSTNEFPSNQRREVVFNFVESELKDVLQNGFIPKGITYGRANYWTAAMTLAKLYLNSEVYIGEPKWVEAIEILNEIVFESPYDLEDDFYNNFRVKNEGSIENMFVIVYGATSIRGAGRGDWGFNMGQMTLHYSMTQTGGRLGWTYSDSPWNGFCVLEEYYNQYDATDERKKSFINGPVYSITDTTGEQDVIRVTSSYDYQNADKTDWHLIKDGNEDLILTTRLGNIGEAERNTGTRIGKFEYTTNSRKLMENDFPIYRYADAVLMLAEAQFRNSSTVSSEAQALWDQIRTRVGLSPVTASLENIYKERQLELFSEMHNRQDMIRFGKFNGSWWEKTTSSPEKNIFPIPLNQRNVNSNLCQNPSYNGFIDGCLK